MTWSSESFERSVIMSSLMPSEKILLLRVAAHISEGEDGDGMLVRQRRNIDSGGCQSHG
jgi:hypothetical protein